MNTLFDERDRVAILQRLGRLQPASERQWGKMNASQMMAHCAAALEVGTGLTPRKQALIGKIFAPFVRSSLLGDKPFGRNSPTDPTFIVADERDFAKEKQRLVGVIGRFAEGGPAEAARHVHSFLGKLQGEEWGVMMWKHMDHHLRQFGL